MGTVQALDMGVVDVLILWDGLQLMRLLLRHPQTGEEQVQFLAPSNAVAHGRSSVLCLETGTLLEIVDSIPLVEWAVTQHSSIGVSLELVTCGSREGHQFCTGFRGIGGLLRYEVDLELLDEPESERGQGGDIDDRGFLASCSEDS